MWGMLTNWLRLLFRGRLFRDPRMVLRQWLIGVAMSCVAVVVLARLGLPLWLTVALVALAAGTLQPFLFKHLKYD